MLYCIQIMIDLEDSMKRRRILQAMGIVLSAVLTAAVILPIEKAVRDNSRWMERLSDDAPLNTLAIPGTHDSGALYSFAGVSGKCQSVPIDQQLKMGVRFLDIRLKLVKNELNVVHSFADQKLSLTKVLEDITGFIRENPSEFLLVSFKEDDSPVKSDVPFAARLEEVLSGYSEISGARTLPQSVGEARGRIFVLARYGDASVGIPAYHGWQDSTSFTLNGMYIQDHYQLSDISDKQDDILAAMDTAASGKHSLVLNFTSCYLDHGFPPVSAAAPARKINPWLTETCTSAKLCRGIFVCDFITSDLATAMIERNFS